MVAGAIAGNSSAEATTPTGHTSAEAMRGTGMTQHYVIAGRVEADGQLGGSFAWVAQTADDAQRFIRSTLETHGWTPESRVFVLADGADGLASLLQRATENSAQSILDWFHIVCDSERSNRWPPRPRPLSKPPIRCSQG
jgi:hypothetical protein